MADNWLTRAANDVATGRAKRIEAQIDAEAAPEIQATAPAPAAGGMTQSQFGGRPRTREEIARSSAKLAAMLRARGG